jgi:LuxR family maltose regulon positive regulatory protein
MLARLDIARGRFDEALAPLTGLLDTAAAGGLTGCMIEILALRALSLQGQGQKAQAMIAFSQALSLAEPGGYIRLFVEEGPLMVTLLREARSRGLAPAYVDALLTACGTTGTAVGDSAMLVEPLSTRELELLRLLAAGLSTSEIAAQLFITPGTARNHLKSIFGKLEVHSRVQAVERARVLNLLP